MPREWVRFLFIRLPVALILVAACCQLVAAALSHVQLRRNRSDELALAVSSEHSPHRVVLLGDSVTRDSTSRFMLGKYPGDVINLATNGAIGVPGEYFLLSRYLEAHPAPEYIVLSISPEVYFGIPPTAERRHYLWYTFARPEEHALLMRFLPGIARQDSYPAAMDVSDRVVDRLYGVIRRSPAVLPQPKLLPIAAKPLEPASENLSTQASMTSRVKGDLRLEVPDLEKASLAGICRLAQQNHSQLVVIWPPAPQPVVDGLTTGNVYRRAEQSISAAFGHAGCTASFFHMNSIRPYGNFRLDAMHVRGEGWEERVAADYRDYLTGLPSAAPERTAAPSSP